MTFFPARMEKWQFFPFFGIKKLVHPSWMQFWFVIIFILFESTYSNNLKSPQSTNHLSRRRTTKLQVIERKGSAMI
jgi:hypothetical protein